MHSISPEAQAPQIGKIFTRCFETSEINKNIATAQVLRNPHPLERPRYGQSDDVLFFVLLSMCLHLSAHHMRV